MPSSTNSAPAELPEPPQVSGHVGDAVVLFFPIASSEETGTVCKTAVTAAVAALEALELLAAHRQSNQPKLHARIGIDIGEVAAISTGRSSSSVCGGVCDTNSAFEGFVRVLSGELSLLPGIIALRGPFSFGNGS
jgi:hypothetical protein